jgi:hypothetical protein
LSSQEMRTTVTCGPEHVLERIGAPGESPWPIEAASLTVE